MGDILLPGWTRAAGVGGSFACLTRHLPKSTEPSEAAGKHTADEETLRLWAEDEYCQSPYQYGRRNRVTNGSEERRLLLIEEERRLLPIEEERITGGT